MQQYKKFEHQADAIYRKAIAELFEENNNAIEIIKLKELYENFESSLDKCQDVSDIIEDIALKIWLDMLNITPAINIHKRRYVSTRIERYNPPYKSKYIWLWKRNYYIITIAGDISALFFDFINGFHDSANAIATVVGTRTLKPLHAVSMAAIANFIGPFIFGTAVAATVGKGIIRPEFATTEVILAGLIGAIVWDLITWYFGLPSSSSHALIGGLIGSALISGGIKTIVFKEFKNHLFYDSITCIRVFSCIYFCNTLTHFL